MTVSVVIICPAADLDAINGELTRRGHGPCMSVPMAGDNMVARDIDGNLLDEPTHYGCHWWVSGRESTLATLAKLREGVFVSSDIIVRGRPTRATTLKTVDADIRDPGKNFIDAQKVRERTKAQR